MEYPEDFSAQARARVEAERLKAGEQLEQRRNQVPWSRYGPVRADEENLRKYILRVFLVFAQEACKLGSRAQWTVDRIRSEADEFLRRFAIEGYYDKGYDKQRRKLREMICHSSGGILPEVQWVFEKSAEWHQFEQELLAVAEQQAGLAQLEAEATEAPADKQEEKGQADTVKKSKKSPIGFEDLPEVSVPDYIASVGLADRQQDSAGLTERQYDCAMLRWVHELSVSEVSRRLDIDRSTVLEHLSLAKVKIDKDELKQAAARSRAKVKPGNQE